MIAIRVGSELARIPIHSRRVADSELPPRIPRDRPSSDVAIREGTARFRLRQEDPLRSRAHVFAVKRETVRWMKNACSGQMELGKGEWEP